MARYVVTGALGNVGASVVETLRQGGHEVRAADIALEAMRDRFGDRVEARLLDFTDPSTFGPVLTDAEKVFLIRPPAISRVGPTLNCFIDAAAAGSVEHIVFSSVAGADTNRIVPHHRVEKHLMASELTWTMLRPGFFAQNIGTAYRKDIVDDDRIYVPAADGLVAFIDARDIGDVAAKCLTEPGHDNRGYHLTGPEAVTFNQVAAMLEERLQRPIRYEPAPILGYFRHLRRQGLAAVHAVVQTVLHTGLRRGDAQPVIDTIDQLLGRPARTLGTYLDDHLAVWQPEAH